MTDKPVYIVSDTKIINRTSLYLILKQVHNNSHATPRLKGRAAAVTGKGTPVRNALQVMHSATTANAKGTTAHCAAREPF